MKAKYKPSKDEAVIYLKIKEHDWDCLSINKSVVNVLRLPMTKQCDKAIEKFIIAKSSGKRITVCFLSNKGNKYCQLHSMIKTCKIMSGESLSKNLRLRVCTYNVFLILR